MPPPCLLESSAPYHSREFFLGLRAYKGRVSIHDAGLVCCHGQGKYSTDPHSYAKKKPHAGPMAPCSLQKRWHHLQQVLTSFHQYDPGAAQNTLITPPPEGHRLLLWLQTTPIPRLQGLSIMTEHSHDPWRIAALLAWRGHLRTTILSLSTRNVELMAAQFTHVQVLIVHQLQALTKIANTYLFERIIGLCYHHHIPLFLCYDHSTRSLLAPSPSVRPSPQNTSMSHYVQSLKSRPVVETLSPSARAKLHDICRLP